MGYWETGDKEGSYSRGWAHGEVKGVDPEAVLRVQGNTAAMFPFYYDSYLLAKDLWESQQPPTVTPEDFWRRWGSFAKSRYCMGMQEACEQASSSHTTAECDPWALLRAEVGFSDVTSATWCGWQTFSVTKFPQVSLQSCLQAAVDRP